IFSSRPLTAATEADVSTRRTRSIDISASGQRIQHYTQLMPVVRAIEPGVHVVDVALDDFEVRGALVVGEVRAAGWDTLSSPRDMTPWLPFVGDRELVIVYSHADWDHVWGTAGLPYHGCSVVAHTQTGVRFGHDVPAKLASKRTAEPGRWRDVVLVPPTDCFDHEHSIDLGGLTLLLQHLPGYTESCTVGFLPEFGILLPGCTVGTTAPV